MSADAVSELAANGTLRAAINLGNPLLVTGRTPAGDPVGVSPDMAAAIAERLGVGLALVPFASPGEIADAATEDAWDICLIAEDPKRAEVIAFAPAYVEIEATYLVPADSPLKTIEDVDRPGVRVAVSERSAYDLYLSRALKHAELRRARGLAGAAELFVTENLEALAGLRPALTENAGSLPGSRVLDGCYTTVQQAVGCQPGRPAALAFLTSFIAEATSNELVASLIEKHGVQGRLQVAPGR